jgi:hypothetical protein
MGAFSCSNDSPAAAKLLLVAGPLSLGNEGALQLPNQLGACFHASVRLYTKQAVGQAQCARRRHTLQRRLLYYSLKLLDIDRRSGRGWFAGRQHMLQRSLLRKPSSQ